MFQNFIFRYYHNLDVKHVTTSNYAFLYISWQTLCELVCVYDGGGGGGGVAAHNISKDEDVNRKCSQCKLKIARFKWT